MKNLKIYLLIFQNLKKKQLNKKNKINKKKNKTNKKK